MEVAILEKSASLALAMTYFLVQGGIRVYHFFSISRLEEILSKTFGGWNKLRCLIVDIDDFPNIHLLPIPKNAKIIVLMDHFENKKEVMNNFHQMDFTDIHCIEKRLADDIRIITLVKS